MEASAEVAVRENGQVARPEAAGNALQRMRDLYTDQDRGEIAAYLNIEPENPALTPYLAICAQYGFHPLMGQVWLIEKKKRGRDGDADQKMYAPAVGRDGLLAVAHRTPEFIGIPGDVVCEFDDFEVAWTGREDDPVITHVHAPKPKEFPDGDDPGKWRGRILGAWCKVLVKGKAPTYYYARLSEHAQVGEGRDGKYFKGAWAYTSTMIQKSAQSVALRWALGVTGIVPADELRTEAEVETESHEDAVERAVMSLELENNTLGILLAAIREANEAEPNSWNASKVTLRLSGQSEQVAAEVIEEIRADARRARERNPEPEVIADAEVVEEADEATEDEHVVVTVERLEIGAQVSIDEGGNAAPRVRRVRDLLSDPNDPDAGVGVFWDDDEAPTSYERGTEFRVKA